MSRLIDRPGAQRTVQTIVDRSVLVELLWNTARAQAIHAAPDSEIPMRIADLAQQVESGERVSLTAVKWREIGGGE